ncbi:helix-turn-helix domain-containing protein [Nocardia sp. CNY236]|uniref:winged helix-turn-helix transcriptional regulator n=1 Tax=Nocardia sp. CNY236 TaxID=1169152 RepID=UPI00040B5518|nr:helix-turn-helix domain-containing protein [Nocardia sp. CNY236]
MESVSVINTKSYGQGCPIAIALDVLGDRWTLLILRDLAHAPLRFLDLQALNAGLSSNLLTTRLRQLEARGLVTRYRLAAPATAHVYALVPQARDDVLEVLNALGRFGAGLLASVEQQSAPESMLRQLKCTARLLEGKHLGIEGEFALVFDGESYGLSMSANSVAATREPAPDPVATVAAPSATMALLANRGLTLEQAEQRGLTISGDRRAGLALVDGLSLK